MPDTARWSQADDTLGVASGDAFGAEALALAEQSAGIGVWSIDLATGLARGTAQYFRIMGLEPTSERIPMEAVRALRHPEDRERVVAGFRQALEGGADLYEIEYRIIRPDGEIRWIFGRGRVVRDAAGTPVSYSGVDLDITERKVAQTMLAAAMDELERMNQELEQRISARTAELAEEAERRAIAEARLHQAQKMEAVGQLTGGIAHDFNNILQVIVGNLEIARRVLTREETRVQPAPSREFLLKSIETAQRATRNATETVQRLLAFSRRQALAPAVLSANALINEMAGMIRLTLGESIHVDFGLHPDPWPAFADINQLQSAILNLVVNARDAMPQGGRVLVETANVDVDGTSGDDIAPGQYVMLGVSDTGCGVAKDDLHKVFDPFFSTKETGKGSGLGLSMVYGFVKQSGGHVRIQSEVGSGTTVRIYLPRSSSVDVPNAMSAPSDGVERDEAHPRAREGETILLVEDYEEARRFGTYALETLGYRVLQAADGPSALLLLESQDATSIDLLFTDVVLPGGMSGEDLARAVCARQAGIPVLYTTGYTPRAIDHRGRIDPEIPLLPKPYTLASLARNVRHAIDRARMPAGAAAPLQ